MDPIESDERFKKLGTDKKFRSVSKKHKKVKIDKRFQSVFTDTKFVNKCDVDKRGRPKHLSAKESFEKFYDVDSSGSDKEEEESQDEVSEPENLVEDEKIKAKLRDDKVDYARGEGALYSDSSSSSEESDSDDEESEGQEKVEEETNVFDKWGELDHEAERTEDATKRLAVCNMDWDRVGASDIFLVLSSFCPSGGSVSKVSVFLSEFGRERVEEEQSLGPKELRASQEEEEEGMEEDEEEAMARVRKYQINRLKYYYAVAEFDSVETADRIYSECDGMEYELSATRFDLRFIPEDMQFSESPTDDCDTKPDPDKYQPKCFQTTALQQQKVELTWDETDPNREKSMKKAYEAYANGEENDGDLEHARNLIASASEDESDNDEAGIDDVSDGEVVNDKDMISRYKALVSGLNNGEDGSEGNMEMEFSDHGSSEADQTDINEEGPWEQYLQKKRMKKKSKKEVKSADKNDVSDDEDKEQVSDKKNRRKRKERNIPDTLGDEDHTLNLMTMDSDDEKDHFNFKDIVESETKITKKSKKWKKKKKELEVPVNDNFEVDVSDGRFSALFTRPEFNIDPTDSNFKKTKSMDKIIGEKLKRKAEPLEENSEILKKNSFDPELSRSLKSVKNKWKKNSKKRNKIK